MAAENYFGRVRLSEISDYTAQTLHSFVESEVAGGNVVKTDGSASYNNLLRTDHDKQVVENQLAHNVLPWIYRIFQFQIVGDRRLPWSECKALAVLSR